MALITESCKTELVKLWQRFLEIKKQKQNVTGNLERSPGKRTECHSLPLKLCWFSQKHRQNDSTALSERNKETWQTSFALDEPWNSILKMNKSHDAKSDPSQQWFASQTGLRITNYQIPAGRIMFAKHSLQGKERQKWSYDLEKSHLDKTTSPVMGDRPLPWSFEGHLFFRCFCGV